ncbi:MAG: indolepyruvate ferredoxin oxidoreductase subunit alpha [Pseudomonadota bacterium]
MKHLGELLLREDSFDEIVMGNEAVVRAMVETRTRVVSSYPGSPTPEIAATIRQIPEEGRPFYFEFSVNEKVAAEVAFGASLNGNLSCVFFKSVGLNVALDTVVQLGMMNLPGGMVVIVGDDPGANSSQNEQDNRHSFAMARLTVFEPASPQEVYEYYKQAADLAIRERTAVVLRMTTHVCHAREKVRFQGYTRSADIAAALFSRDNGPYIPITARAIELKRSSMKKLANALDFVRQSGINRMIQGKDSGNRGIITAGLTCLSLLDCLETADARPDILKLGAVFPLDRDALENFLKSHDQVLILEELDDILETSIKALAFDRGIRSVLKGKSCDEDFIGEYTPDKVNGILRKTWPDLFTTPADPAPVPVPVPERPAQMCPGCGHRSAFHAIKIALRDTDITVADIGCHTLGFLPPYTLGEVLLCMGASPGIAAGLSLFNHDRRVLAFLGDSTLFHAGLPGIINAIFNRHNITLVIMENGTTAMTGHQDHAGRDIPIEQLLKGLGIVNVTSCDTYDQARLTTLVTQALDAPGFNVVIARHPCMLKFMRSQRKKSNFKQRNITVDPNTCTRVHQCVEVFACPSFVRNGDQSVGVNPDLCIGDGSCRAVCPEKALSLDKGV